MKSAPPPSLKLRRASLAIVALALIAFSARAAEPAPLRLTLGRVEVLYAPGDARLARQAAESVQFAAGLIAREFGIAFLDPVNVFIVHGRDAFHRACATPMPDWAMAAALSGRDAIVLDAALAVELTANDARLTLIHETVHLALARIEANRADPLPRWFHEGLATWLSGQRHLRGDSHVFEIAAVHGAIIPLDRLKTGFPSDAGEATLAYLESEMFIAHIVRTRSAESLRWILDAYRGGQDFEAAFRSALGLSRPELEKDWRESLHRSYPWLRTLIASLTFWSALAFATIGIFFLVRRRNRLRLEQWKAEERAFELAAAEENDEDEPPDDEPPPYFDQDDDLA